MSILRLTLKKKWFDMIKSDLKKEEYREIKQHWINRLTWHEYHSLNRDQLIKANTRSSVCRKDFDIIEFKNGYGKNAPVINVECKGIIIKLPNKQFPEWHDNINDLVFVIKLGNVLKF